MKFFVAIMFFLAVDCQDNNSHGCKVACDCPDFTDLFSSKESLMFTKWDGCTFNATCSPGTPGILEGKWYGGEIDIPLDAEEDRIILSAGMVPFNMYSAFGIICENGAWYATKYPEGVGYINIMGDKMYVGTLGELDGKKSKIYIALCDKV
ncbi:unnamed protein product [Caenorhabditis brenneri]